MSIPSNFIDQILDQSDIVDIIGRRIQLNKKGQNFTCGDDNSLYEKTGQWPDADICLFLDNGNLNYYTIKKKIPVKINNKMDKDSEVK